MSVLALYPSHHQTSPCQFWEKIFSHTDPDFGNENKDGCQTGIVMKFFSRVSQVQLQLLSNKYLAGKQGEKKHWSWELARTRRFPILDICLPVWVYLFTSVSMEYENKMTITSTWGSKRGSCWQLQWTGLSRNPLSWKQRGLTESP